MQIEWGTVVNVIIAVVTGLLVRWVAGIVRSMEQSIRIAVLELKDELTRTYVTKPELESVRDDLVRQIDIVGRIDSGFARTATLIRQHSSPPCPMVKDQKDMVHP